MCGIAGSFNWPEADVSAMVQAMHHRGPDDSGGFRDGPCVMGMSRLAIIDTSKAGHQPMLWKNEVALVFNGEIYNHAELRADLRSRGRLFSSESDTEVVLQLYLSEGEAFVQRLRGMFAIAIYDRRPGPGREILLLARDPFGIKPLLVASDGDRIVFASELRSLLASGVISPKFDYQAVRQLLMRGAVVQPRTLLAGVHMLMPSTLMRITASHREEQTFWKPAPNIRSEVSTASYEEQVDLVEAELMRCVKEQMVADVPLGAFLSGGLDSSIVVGLMSRYADRPVRTFSVGFGPEAAELDETEDAVAVAAALGAEHRRIEITDEFVADHIEHFADDLDQPSVDGLNSWLVSQAAAPHVKVALSGTGGDELFAGYPWFASMQQIFSDEGVSGSQSGVLSLLLSRFANGPRSGSFVGRFASQYRHFDPATAARLLGGTAEDMEFFDIVDMEPSDELLEARVLDRTSVLCLRTYTLNQLLRDIDATSMAHSLEVRVPFLDPSLLDLALSLPEASRLSRSDPAAEPGSYRALGTKKILLDVASRLIPFDLGTRAKRGFSLPIDRWLRGPMRETLEATLRSPPASLAEHLDPRQLCAVLEDFLAGRIHWGRPWILLILTIWSEQILAPRGSAALSQPVSFATFT